MVITYIPLGALFVKSKYFEVINGLHSTRFLAKESQSGLYQTVTGPSLEQRGTTAVPAAAWPDFASLLVHFVSAINHQAQGNP